MLRSTIAVISLALIALPAVAGGHLPEPRPRPRPIEPIAYPLPPHTPFPYPFVQGRAQ